MLETDMRVIVYPICKMRWITCTPKCSNFLCIYRNSRRCCGHSWYGELEDRWLLPQTLAEQQVCHICIFIYIYIYMCIYVYTYICIYRYRCRYIKHGYRSRCKWRCKWRCGCWYRCRNTRIYRYRYKFIYIEIYIHFDETKMKVWM